MTSKSMGKRKFRRPVDRKPLKYWSRNWSEWLRHGSIQPCKFWWKSVQRGLLPLFWWNITYLWLCVPSLPFPSLPFPVFLVAYSKNGWTDFHDVYIKRRGFAQWCAFWGFRWQRVMFGVKIPQKTYIFGAGLGVLSQICKISNAHSSESSNAIDMKF